MQSAQIPPGGHHGQPHSRHAQQHRKAPAGVFIEQNEGLTLLDSTYADEDYAICLKKGNDALQDAVNQALNELIEDGTVQAIIDKYIPSK